MTHLRGSIILTAHCQENAKFLPAQALGVSA